MSDIVERLQGHVETLNSVASGVYSYDISEAIDEIERLREELENERARGIHTCGPNCQRLACRQRREIEQLQAQVEALQNKCAQRGLSPEDSDRLQARCERLEAMVDAAKQLQARLAYHFSGTYDWKEQENLKQALAEYEALEE